MSDEIEDPNIITHPDTETNGPSPKAVMAALASLLFAFASSLTAWALTGFTHFDTAAIVLAAVGVGHAVLVYGAAWFAHPGDVVQLYHGVASDAKLPPEALTVIDTVVTAEDSQGNNEILKAIEALNGRLTTIEGNVNTFITKPPE